MAMDAETSKDLIFSVHFGKFYMIDAARCFDRQQGSISCADIETAVANGKKNQKIGMERPEFDAFSVPDDLATKLSSTSMKKSAINANRGTNGYGRKGQEPSSSSSIAKKGQNVSSSFWSSLPINEMSRDTEETIEQKFRAIAIILGYQQIACFVDDDRAHHGGHKESGEMSLRCGTIAGTTLLVPGVAWKIEVVASMSYSTHVTTTTLPRKMSSVDSEVNNCLGDVESSNRVVEKSNVGVHERFLAWIHATLLCASPAEKSNESPERCFDDDLVAGGSVGKIEPNLEGVDSFRHHDLRFKVGNNKPVKKNTSLYETVLPQGLLPVEMNEEGRPTVRSDSGLKENITFIRRVKKRIVFGSPGLLAYFRGQQGEHDSESERDLNVNAKMVLILSIGIHYEGVGLQEEIPFIDLSLDGDMTEVCHWIQEQGQGENLEGARQSLSCTIEEVLRVSERIRQLW